MTEKLEALIFDLDQTLMHLSDDWTTVDHYALEAMVGFLKTSPTLGRFEADALRKAFVEKRSTIYDQFVTGDYQEVLWEDILADALSQFVDVTTDDMRLTIEQALFAYSSEVFMNYKTTEGAAETLKALKGKVYLGLVTNFTSVQSVEFLLRSNGLNMFDGVFVSSDDSIMCRKPGKKIFEAVQKELDAVEVSSDHTIMVGDNIPEDLIPAAEMGWQTLHFTQYKHQTAEIPWMAKTDKEFMPTYTVATLAEGKDILLSKIG